MHADVRCIDDVIRARTFEGARPSGTRSQAQAGDVPRATSEQARTVGAVGTTTQVPAGRQQDRAVGVGMLQVAAVVAAGWAVGVR